MLSGVEAVVYNFRPLSLIHYLNILSLVSFMHFSFNTSISWLVVVAKNKTTTSVTLALRIEFTTNSFITDLTILLYDNSAIFPINQLFCVFHNKNSPYSKSKSTTFL